MSDQSKLLSTFEHQILPLKNKMVMAPMTRSRATADHIPTDIMSVYYEQRAGAGLIITEGTAPSPNGVGYPRIPGIYNPDQIEGWKKVVEKVHAKGGKIFIQLMHTGRVSHPENMPKDAQVVAPSAIAPESTKMYVDGKGELSIPTPKAMTKQDIEQAINDYVLAAQNAIEAGFDGVELHAANGYLIEQFLNPSANQRTDRYGGSVENRNNFAIEVTEAVAKTIGKEKVGIRLSPNGTFNDVGPFDEQAEAFDQLSQKLNDIGLIYIHLVNHKAMGSTPLPDDIRNKIRENFKGILILSGGYDYESANKDLENNLGDLVAFGRPYLANPDLPERFAAGSDLNQPNYDTMYTPGTEGYIDYPMMSTTEAI